MKKTFQPSDEVAFRKSVGLSLDTGRPIVCVQGLGFVGAAMAVAISKSTDENDDLCFDVVGVDLPKEPGLSRISAINSGVFPFDSSDDKLKLYTDAGHKNHNLVATSDAAAFQFANVVVVDVNLDVNFSTPKPSTDFGSLKNGIRSVGKNICPNALVLVETTLPPGTCEHVLFPLLRECFINRGLNPQDVMLAHSYERVMPGPDYLESITDFWRVYAGINDHSAEMCLRFIEKIVNVEKYPPKRLSSITASETAKVLENTFRAVNIALIDEWSNFAEGAGVNLFEVIDAIRDRPTHNNIRQPGFGVGGYCLTKDPLFAGISQREFFPEINVTFPFADLAIETNRVMPIRNLDRILSLFPKSSRKISMLMMGVAYKADIDDTRYSAAEIFYLEALSRGVSVSVHDPKVTFWSECDVAIPPDLPDAQTFDVIVLCVAHTEYIKFDIVSWIGKACPLVYDCDNVLKESVFQELTELGVRVFSAGRSG